MAIKEYKLQSSNIPYAELRIFICDTQTDVPETQSIQDNDMFFFKDTKSWAYGATGLAQAFVVDSTTQQLCWDDQYDAYKDTPTMRHRVQQLAERVQALEDNS